MIAKLFAYFTNHVVSHAPFFALRHAWCRRVAGIRGVPARVIGERTQELRYRLQFRPWFE